MDKKTDEPLIEAKPQLPYNPSQDLQLDLTHFEKIRVTALMLAIQYYERTIVTDGALYSAMKAHGCEFRPAHPDHVVEIGMQFCHFILGNPISQADMQALEVELAGKAAPTEEGSEGATDKETPDYVRDFDPQTKDKRKK